MALIAEEEDTRPRNPEHRRLIDQMMNPERLRREIDFDDIDSLDHSIDDCLDNTDDFREWARKKRIGTSLDPENRKPVQMSDSPLSDYNIEFTRLNKTSDSITPSSLSSLNIPTTSNVSLTILNSSTPSAPSRRTRASNAARRSAITPSQILREKQQYKIGQLTSSKKSILQRDYMRGFHPNGASTPVRVERKRPSVFVQSARVETESVVSSSNEKSNAEKTLTPMNDRSERTLTNRSNAAEVVSSSIIPETQTQSQTQTKNSFIVTQQNESVIPQTQANDSVIPETQENESSSAETHDDYVPETQDSELPATQDAVENNPVQAQVTNQNTEQQAEPRYNFLDYSTRRIQPRPPIHTPSQVATPSNTPSTKPAPKTPSRLPIPIIRTPKPVRTTALTPLTPFTVRRPEESARSEVTSSNGHYTQASQMPVSLTPFAQSNQPSTVPQAVMPAPTNVTVNVNVNNSASHSPQQARPTRQTRQTRQTTCTNDQHIDNATNGGARRNSSNDSLMTDDDSSENQTNLSNRCETPKADSSSTSARRILFPTQNDDAEQNRRSATFNKSDNLTRTIMGSDTIPSPILPRTSRSFKTRATNSIIPNVKSPNMIAPANSETFVKSKVSSQNATYDLENQSTRSSIANERVSIDTEEISSNATRNTYNTDADLPSEAILDSMQLTEDEMNDNNANGSSDQSSIDKSQHVNKTSSNPKTKMIKCKSQLDIYSTDLNPVVRLEQIQFNTPRSCEKSVGNRIDLNLRESQPFGPVSPPEAFQNSTNDNIIHEKSPASQLATAKPIKFSPPKIMQKKKRTTRKGKKDSNVEDKHLHKPDNKPQEKKSIGRPLRSSDNIHENDDDKSPDYNRTTNMAVAATETATVLAVNVSNTNQSTSAIDDFSFKVPSKPPPRKAKSTRADASDVSSPKLGESQEELVVTLEIELPIDDDEPSVNGNEPNTSSNQTVEKQTSTKRKPKNVPNSRATKTTEIPTKPTKPSKSKSKAKEPEAAINDENDQSMNVTTASSITVRRSSRDRKPAYNERAMFMKNHFDSITNVARLNVKAAKRTSKAIEDAPRSVPHVSSRDNSEKEPPRKKPRAASERSHHTVTRPSHTSKSVKSLKMSVKSNNTTASRNAADFTEFKRYVESNMHELDKLQWWNEMCDITQKDAIVHSADEVDVEHINNIDGIIEVSSTDKIEYVEMNGVDYGFVPSSVTRRCGFMRFQPNAIKAKTPNFAEVVLHVLNGEFTLQCDDVDMDILAGVDVIVPKGASYGLQNRSKYVGIVQFIYITNSE